MMCSYLPSLIFFSYSIPIPLLSVIVVGSSIFRSKKKQNFLRQGLVFSAARKRRYFSSIILILRNTYTDAWQQKFCMTILHFITLSTVWHYSTVITFLHLYTAHSSSSSQSSLDTKLLFPEHRCNFNGRFVAFFVSINTTLHYKMLQQYVL